MEKYDVSVFKPYPFRAGQKITIAAGPRRGDWEIVGVTEKTVKLKCPISFREFEWNRFCYHVETRVFETWPQED